jgi:hypothetical protein
MNIRSFGVITSGAALLAAVALVTVSVFQPKAEWIAGAIALFVFSVIQYRSVTIRNG